MIEANEQGQVISYEEYYAYGSTAYSASSSSADLSLKRYRFTGKERDEETGLDYFGVRYYASWLGRWTSADPGGFVDGLNLYRYTRNNPVNGVDRKGYQTDPPNGGQKAGEPILDEKGNPILDANKQPILASGDGTGLAETNRSTTFDFDNPWGAADVSSIPISDGPSNEFPIGGPIELPEGFAPNSALSSAQDELKLIPKEPTTFGNRKTHDPNSANNKYKDPRTNHNPIKDGFEPMGGTTRTTPGEHAMGIGLENSRYISYSENATGAETMNGKEFFIDLDAVKNKGTEVIDNKALIREVDAFIKEEPVLEKASKKWLDLQGLNQEQRKMKV